MSRRVRRLPIVNRDIRGTNGKVRIQAGQRIHALPTIDRGYVRVYLTAEPGYEIKIPVRYLQEKETT